MFSSTSEHGAANTKHGISWSIRWLLLLAWWRIGTDSKKVEEVSRFTILLPETRGHDGGTELRHPSDCIGLKLRDKRLLNEIQETAFRSLLSPREP